MPYILLRSPRCPQLLGDYYFLGKGAGGRRGPAKVTQVIERIEAHYEVQEVEMGTLYRWCPESVAIECDCGQSFSAEGAKAASCPRCGAEHTGLARELGDKKPLTEEEAYRPARREYEAWMKDEGSHRRHAAGLYVEGLFSGLAAKDEMNRVLDVLYGS
jgi:hypothetical protein